ncbi:conjugal transfer protein TrbL family protein [Nonomuraea bangladeshensis]|uniref:conjugal transfer protein TrbL family protein n=1 Tax=Nonomuraea bangladeshensis TaxID=404385 RepID=UPI0031E3B2D4
MSFLLAATVTGLATPLPARAEPTPTPSATTSPSPAPSPQVTWIPPATTPPTTSPTTPPGEVPECGWMDVGCKLNQAMNGWFTSLVTDAINPAFVTVGSVLLAAPPPLMLERVRELSGHVRLVANALLVLMVVAGGVIVMAHGTSPGNSTTPGEIIPRLIVAVITLNASLTICQYAIELTNAMVTALLGDGVDGQRAGNLIAAKVDALIKDPTGTVLFLVLLIGTAVLMGLLLTFIGVIRVTLLLFLIITAPLALLCHALPQTEGIARLWWRSFFGLLAIQILQAIGLILAFKLVLTDSAAAYPLAPATPSTGDAVEAMVRPTANRALDVLILIGVLFVLIKIPGWVAKTIWQQGQPTMLKRLVKAVIVYKTLGAARSLGKTGRAAAARTSGTPAAHRHGRPGNGKSGPGRSPKPGSPTAPKPPTGPKTGAAMPNRSPSWQQLELPLNLPASTPSAPTPEAAAASARRARQGTQLALPFPVTRVPRPPAPAGAAPSRTPSASSAPSSAAGAPMMPWIRPRPPWVQDRLPGMPTRPPRPGQLRLRLDPPPRRTTRAQRQPPGETR